MNIVKALEQLGLTGWTFRGDPEVGNDQNSINRIEWNGSAPALTWEQLQAAADAVAAVEAAKASLAQTVASGFDTGLGYSLGVADGDQIAFSKIASGLQLIGAPDTFPMEIKDVSGTMRAVTFGEFKTIMGGYIPFCYNLWKSQ